MNYLGVIKNAENLGKLNHAANVYKVSEVKIIPFDMFFVS